MSRLKDFFQRSVSGLAATLHQPRFKAPSRQVGVTRKLGKRGTLYRRIIAAERLGPFFQQIGIKWKGFTAEPIMRGYYIHRFLHATKGWREYLDVPRAMARAGQVFQHNHNMYRRACRAPKPSRVYMPNGKRECARRRGQDAWLGTIRVAA